MAPKQAIDWRQVMAPQGRHSALVQLGSGAELVARHCVGLAYLAAPYAQEAQIRKEWRMDKSLRASMMAARELIALTDAGVSAICPTVMRAEMLHAITTVPGINQDPLDDDYWSGWSVRYLTASSIVVVPNLQGWARCPQVARDVAWALSRNIPVHIYAAGL